jgi:hypothetical protein
VRRWWSRQTCGRDKTRGPVRNQHSAYVSRRRGRAEDDSDGRACNSEPAVQCQTCRSWGRRGESHFVWGAGASANVTVWRRLSASASEDLLLYGDAFHSRLRFPARSRIGFRGHGCQCDGQRSCHGDLLGGLLHRTHARQTGTAGRRTAAASWLESRERGDGPSSSHAQSADQWAFRRPADIIQVPLVAFHGSRSAWTRRRRAVGTTPGYYQNYRGQNKQCAPAHRASGEHRNFALLAVAGSMRDDFLRPAVFHASSRCSDEVGELRRATGAEHRVLQRIAHAALLPRESFAASLAASTHESAAITTRRARLGVVGWRNLAGDGRISSRSLGLDLAGLQRLGVTANRGGFTRAHSECSRRSATPRNVAALFCLGGACTAPCSSALL